MAPFQPEDKVLVNGKHAEVKTLKDIRGGHFEVGVVYTEDKRFDTVIYNAKGYIDIAPYFIIGNDAR